MRRRDNNGLTYVEGRGYEGVVYCYTNSADDDKVYVGCTPREKTRRDSWKNWANAYAGSKIAQARKESQPGDWQYSVLERMYSEDPVELEKKLEKREAEYIEKLDSCDNGYNSNRGGTGNTGMTHSEETRELISKNHRQTQSEETKRKLSERFSGHVVKESTRRNISEKNTGKKRTDEMKKAQSDRMKGKEPVAATIGAKAWVEQNGGGYWKGKKIPEEARVNMKKAQQQRGIGVIAHFPDGHTQSYNTLLDAEKATGVKVGSIHNNLKHSSEQFRTKTGFWFEKEK